MKLCDKAWISVWTLVLSMLLFQVSSAQTDRFVDKIVLQNGSIIWGLTEMEQGQVRIFLTEEDSLLIPEKMVKLIKTGKFNPKLYLDRREGPYYELSTGVLVGKGHHSFENEASFSASFTGGYRFKRMLGIGLGVGVNYYTDQRHVPLYLDLQGDWLEGRITPFHQLNVGWSFASDRDHVVQVDQLDGGFYLSPSVGVRWHLATYSWHFKVSYVRQEATRHFEPVDLGNGSSLTSVEERTLQRVGISVGVSF
ncbi:MAG: hypothetical protein DHS20C17_23930 [Cyclobacteriaceae bacterium]|nr:MAG: hypothetical protein DHS20C17_23930 [Cyclobacteriaceae bacterium]